MSDINWKDGAVCYFAKKQWFPNNGALGGMLKGYIHHYNYGDFQLNEIREGDFIPASELDTEQKYNEVVEVFGLFGFKFKGCAISEYRKLKASDGVTCCSDGLWQTNSDRWNKRQLTHSQIIAIGKLKRMMLESEKKTQLEKWGDYAGKENIVKYNPATMAIKCDGSVIVKPKRRNKSKQAYDILKSLDYEYDLVKQRWFKKQYID